MPARSLWLKINTRSKSEYEQNEHSWQEPKRNKASVMFPGFYNLAASWVMFGSWFLQFVKFMGQPGSSGLILGCNFLV